MVSWGRCSLSGEHTGALNKIVLAVSYSLISVSLAGEINFAGLFEGGSDAKIIEHRKLEEKLEGNLNNFRSVASSKVVIPVNNNSRVESLWGMTEARVLPVEVILKLKKRKRLSLDEYKGIFNLVASSLAERNQVVQPVIRDEDGFEWSEESAEAKELFKATALENEIWDRLKIQWNRNVTWTQVHVSAKDGACKISGTYSVKAYNLNLQLRRDVMSLLQDLCPSARLSMTPSREILEALTATSMVQWVERIAYLIMGFAIWGIYYALTHRKKLKKDVPNTEDDGAIILTKIVERSPDQAAKWMVQALLSESKSPADPVIKSPEPPIEKP